MPKPQYITASDGTQLDAGIVNLAKAMRSVESGNNYNARGKSGEFGAFQWMPNTWLQHAQAAGVDPSDRSPVAQDKVAYKVIEARKRAGLTPEQIISEWNSGRPNAYAQGHQGVNAQGVAYNTPAHTQKVIAEFQKLKAQTPQQPQQATVNPDSLQGDLQKRKQQFVQGQEQMQSGEIGPARGLLRAAGAGAGALGDIAGRALSAVVPDAIETPVMEQLGAKVQQGAESPLGSLAVQGWQKLNETNPEVAQDIRDVGNIAGVTPYGVAGGIGAKAAGRGALKMAEGSAEKQIAGLAADYAEVLGTRSPLRARVDRAQAKGRDLATFLAEKARGPQGAKLEVDKDGSVDATKLIAKNDADVQGLYKLRSELLKQYPEQGDIEQYRAMALKAADSAENQAKGIVDELQKEINGIVDSLKKSFGDRVPLEVLQDIKIAQRIESKAFNALKPKRDRFSNSNYLLSDAAKRYIEDITQNPMVRELNDLIGQHLDADDLLERIKVGGAKVRGGRLGKYTGMGIGALAGSMLESAMGPIMGGLAGNYAVGLILKNQVSGPLRNFLLKRLEVEQPEVYKKVQDFIGQEELRRSQMLQLPAAGQSSFKDPTIYGRAKGPGSTDLQEAVDAQGARGLVPPPGAANPSQSLPKPAVVPSAKDTKKPGLLKRVFGDLSDERGFVKNPLAKKGLLTPPKDVTLKSLTTIAEEVKTPTVSKQYLLDLSNRGDLKQPERDLLRNVLNDMDGNDINVADFTKRVETELLPLTTDTPSSLRKKRGLSGMETWDRHANRYENVTLPDELRGPVANYQERLYQSPIKTSAGDVHFREDAPNYFAHSRIEDLPTENIQYGGDLQGDIVTPLTPTRRVIEIQSDLFQKGRLEGEVSNSINRNISPVEEEKILKARAQELSKLEPYRNTWWERVIREEVKQAAKDGKTKLQFPTGETAMKIEGLGDTQTWLHDNPGGLDRTVRPDELKVGLPVSGQGSSWIITDVLGDGKFKAVPKSRYEYDPNAWMGTKKEHDEMIDAYSETFDISGKVDTQNPIYKFYEKDVQKYLTKKYGGKVITDPQGVKWIEIDVDPKAGKMPVEAFGAGLLAAPLLGERE